MFVPEDAWERLDAELEPLEAVELPLAEAAGGALAGDLPATVDVPQADVSAMDGYVLAGPADVGDALPVVATIAAGAPWDGGGLRHGQAARIMTGAVVPEGGDRVVPVEQTDDGDERVVIRTEPAEGAHIRRRAEVLEAGAPLLAASAALTPGAVSLLATHGHVRVPVHRWPRVAVMATGDEVVDAASSPGPGQLRDSNTPFLDAALRPLGVAIEHLGIAPDDPDELHDRVARGLGSDVLLLCGGVSMGEFDFVDDVLAKLGCRTLFDRVAIQPGKPLVVARHDGGWVFGLPGNPASVMVTYWLFVRPALRRLAGLVDGFWHGALAGELSAPLPAGRGKDRFLAATASAVDGRLQVIPHPPRGSHDVAAYARGAALVRVRPDAEAAVAGEPCEVLPLVGR